MLGAFGTIGTPGLFGMELRKRRETLELRTCIMYPVIFFLL